MIKIPLLTGLKRSLADFDEQREKLIHLSRDLVRLSKQIIYSHHRNESDAAQKYQKEADKLLKQLNELVKKHPKLRYEGSASIAVQEFVEAKAFGEVLLNNTIPQYDADYLDEEYYLLGLCDLVGELNRRAVNAAIKGDKKLPEQIRAAVDELYGFFIQLDLRNGELRKKVDGIKYELKKLENLVLELKHA